MKEKIIWEVNRELKRSCKNFAWKTLAIIVLNLVCRHLTSNNRGYNASRGKSCFPKTEKNSNIIF